VSFFSAEWVIGAEPRREKNWMGFFPGFEPNRSTTLPLYHYSLVPGRTLRPADHPESELLRYGGKREAEVLQYALSDAPPTAWCVADKLRPQVPNAGTIHHSTPLYRFTLCGRRDPGCVPSAGNTVLLGLGQVKVVHELGQRYRRYVLSSLRGRVVADAG
jgi:hypothetical protein